MLILFADENNDDPDFGVTAVEFNNDKDDDNNGDDDDGSDDVDENDVVHGGDGNVDGDDRYSISEMRMQNDCVLDNIKQEQKVLSYANSYIKLDF